MRKNNSPIGTNAKLPTRVWKTFSRCVVILASVMAFSGCSNPTYVKKESDQHYLHWDEPSSNGATIFDRYWEDWMIEEKSELNADTASFAFWLQHLPLKPDDYKPHYVDNGEVVTPCECCAVIDLPVCRHTDIYGAVLRIRAEYLYDVGRLDDLTFRLRGSHYVNYRDWLRGQWITENGTSVKVPPMRDSRRAFHHFLDMVIARSDKATLTTLLRRMSPYDIKAGVVALSGRGILFKGNHVAICVSSIPLEKSFARAAIWAQGSQPASELGILGVDWPWRYYANDEARDWRDWLYVGSHPFLDFQFYDLSF